MQHLLPRHDKTSLAQLHDACNEHMKLMKLSKSRKSKKRPCLSHEIILFKGSRLDSKLAMPLKFGGQELEPNRNTMGVREAGGALKNPSWVVKIKVT